MQLASLGSRLFAFIIDQLITSLLFFMVMLIFGGAIGLAGNLSENGSPGILGVLLTTTMLGALAVLHFAYFGYCEAEYPAACGAGSTP